MDLRDNRVLISDLREDNFLIRKGLARAISDEEFERDYYKWASKNRDYDIALEERIQKPIQHGHLISKDAKGIVVFDDRKLRYCGHNKISKKYVIEIAPTHFREFQDADLKAFSNKDYFKKLREKGALNYNDLSAYFSNCLAVTAIPVLNDDSIVLLKRNENSEIFPGHWHVIGGMLDTDLTLFSNINPQRKLIDEIHSTIKKEFAEEVSVLDVQIRLQGLVRNIPGTYDFSCIANLNLNLNDFVNCYEKAKEKSDHTEIIRLKTKQELSNFMTKEKITHSGFGSLQIYLNPKLLSYI